MSPKVTVLMPVYNGEKYLHEAIKSILNQTFKDFEFIIINDGSTDGSEQIIKSIKDERIKYYKNSTNLGLTKSLNGGIMMAKGKYIARMDADDISFSARLEKQFKCMEENPDCGVLAAQAYLLNKDSKVMGLYETGRKAISGKQIKTALAKYNCVIHSSVMIKTALAKQYLYDELHYFSQDYDLWLRMCSDNIGFLKLDENLIKFRVHGNSTTDKVKNYKQRNFKTKLLFLKNKIKARNFNFFDFKVLIFILRSFFINDYCLISVKKFVKEVVVKKIAKTVSCFLFFLHKNKSELFFFFPVYEIGGAEKVHTKIVGCFSSEQPWVFFTGKSKNDKLKFLFAKNCQIFEILSYSFFSYRYSRHLLFRIAAEYINLHHRPVILGSNEIIFYCLLPYLRPDIQCVDIIHAPGWEIDFSVSVAERINQRIIINRRTFDYIKSYYAENGIAEKLLKRVVLIENKVPIPDAMPFKKGGKLEIIYVGRGSEEKRINLIAEAINKCIGKNIDLRFRLVGDVINFLDKKYLSKFELMGEIVDDDLLNKIYAEADVIILASEREGFPMVIMEAMAHGVVPISTNIGGVSVHLKNGENSLLIEVEEESLIVREITSSIERLNRDRKLLNLLSINAYNYARSNFSGKDFCNNYKKVLENKA